MQDTELFLSLAEIAGVFVGFGALIAVRGGGASDAWGVAGIGMIVWGGIQVVALALAPVAIGRFEVPWLVALILVVLGLFPDQEPALYLAAVALILFEAAYFLVSLVLSLGRPQAASDPAALPATGSPSA